MNRFFKSVLLTGLFVGTTDIVYSFLDIYIERGHFSHKMFLFIAGGVLGLETAMKGGAAVAFLGLFFHYLIAFLFTLFFYWVFPKLKFLAFNKYLVGVLYAVAVNEFMTLVVLPLTPLPASAGPFDLSETLIGWYCFGAVFGIPVVYNTYKYYNIKN